jgi:predicted ATPase
MADLLMNCPRLQVLVTSRVPLHLRAEQQLVLTPLSQAAALALFRERAQQVQPGLNDDVQMVAAICDQLDRLPLAIELAAAHLKVLSLPVLLERLSQRLLLLRGGARDLPERQRTMREAIGWSYNLLTATQQRWFRALAVFMGGCQFAAAEAVCQGGESLASDDGLSAIEALVDASLVQVQTMRDGLPRYRMLEVIREYAVEQLRTAREEDLYQRRHAEYYVELAEEAQRVGPSQGSREARLELELANGRAALHWAYERGEVSLGLRLAAWFGLFWLKRGQMSEGSMWLERMLALDEANGEQEATPAVRSRAYYNAARLAMHLGRNERARALAREALALAKQTGDEFEITHVLATLGSIALASGKEDEASAYYTESYAAAKRADDAGDARPIGLALLNLGELARKRGELAHATVLLEEALARTQALDMTWGIANILTLLGHLARQEQDYERAKRRYRESLRIYQRLGNATYTAWCLEGIAAVAGAQGSYERATRLAAAAAVLRRAAHTPLPPAEQEDFDKVVMTARAELDESVFTEQWNIGSTLTQDEAISYALQALPA